MIFGVIFEIIIQRSVGDEPCYLLKTVYCYTSCTRQSIVVREGLEHDERSEEGVPQHLVKQV
jgi:hypothetical protein